MFSDYGGCSPEGKRNSTQMVLTCKPAQTRFGERMRLNPKTSGARSRQSCRQNQYSHGFSRNSAFGRLSIDYKSVMDKIGVNKDTTDRRMNCAFQTLRHTYASWAVMKGVPLYVVGKAMGQKTLTMTARYSHLAPGSPDQAFQAVADFRRGA